MTVSLNFFASRFKCPVCAQESQVPGVSPFECRHCGSVFKASMKAALGSGIAVAGFIVTIGTALGMRTAVAAVLACVVGFAAWRFFFEVKLVRRGRNAV
jgi:hypothetical protein